MSKRLDINGKSFGNLIVIKYIGIDGGLNSKWLCKCICGNETIIQGSKLTSGYTISCGCTAKLNAYKHGLSYSRIYRIWRGMKERCNNPNASGYERYGGKGISVCAEWENSFESFNKDMRDSYSDNLTLDRINSSLGYEKSNCRWATYKEQAANRKPQSKNKTTSTG